MIHIHSRVIAVILIALVALSFSAPAGALSPVRLVINGHEIATDVPPQIIDGRTLVPIRVVSENLGAYVEWQQETQTVRIQRGSDELLLTIGSTSATLNGQELTLDVPAQVVSGRTLVPLRFVSETLGARVDWNNETRTVFVDRGGLALTNIEWQADVGRGRLVLDVGGPAEYSYWFDNNVNGKPRLVVQLGTTVKLDNPSFYLGQGGITLVRAGVISANPTRSWVIIDLSERVGVDVTRSPDNTQIWLDINYRVDRVGYDRSSQGMVVNIETTGTVSVEPSLSPDGKTLSLFMPDVDLGSNVEPAIDVDSNDTVKRLETRAVDGGVRVDIGLTRATSVGEYSVQVWDNAVQVFFHAQVSGIHWQRAGDGYIVTVDANVPLGFKQFRLNDPDRIVIDIPHARSSFQDLDLEVGGTTLTRIRASQYQLDPPVVRVVLEAPPNMSIETQKATSGLVLAVKKSAGVGMRIAIDPGHGGKDPGAIGPAGNLEKDVNMQIATRLAASLEKLGATPILLRDGDYFVGLYERPAQANELGVDLFISVHNNGFPDPSKGGTETYYYDNHPLSKALGQAVHKALVAAIGLQDRGLRYENFAVLRETLMPSILIEEAYMTNPSEEQQLINPVFQQKIADAVAKALVDFLQTEVSQAK